MKDQKSIVPDVNLLPSDDLEGRPGGIFLKWALTWGKRIVVTTELIVILAFLSRFWLDTEVANLSEKIEQKIAIVKSEAEFEKSFRALSKRVERSAAIEALPTPLEIYTKIQPLLPPALPLSKIVMDNESVSLFASSDESTLGRLVNLFKNSPNFTNVSVDGVSLQPSGGIVDYSLRASLVKNEKHD